MDPGQRKWTDSTSTQGGAITHHSHVLPQDPNSRRGIPRATVTETPQGNTTKGKSARKERKEMERWCNMVSLSLKVKEEEKVK